MADIDRTGAAISLRERVVAAGGQDQTARLQRALSLQPKVALFGAGNIGRRSLKALRALGVDPVCFGDETRSKIGQTIDGVAVCEPDEAARRIGDSGVWLCTFYSPRASLAAMIARLHTRFGHQVLPFLPLFYLFPAAFEQRYCFAGSLSAVRESYPELEWLYGRLADESSRALLAAQQAFRLNLDSTVLPSPDPVLSLLSEQDVQFDTATFVDCGAYDGDTVNVFVKLSEGRFERIVAYEPDEGNHRKLQESVRNWPAAVHERIECHNQGVWSDNRGLSFAETGTQESAFIGTGDKHVSVVALDSRFADTDRVIVKLDVEGAESDALQGARRLLARSHTIACVSAYHRADHLWSLPRLLEEIAPGRRLYLRPHGYDGADLMLYAFPQN